jgi:hypothetical protein
MSLELEHPTQLVKTAKINIVLDATMLDTFLSCPAKFNMRFNMNKVTTIKANPLDKGGIVHVGNENYYKSIKMGLPFDKALDNGLVAARIELSSNSDLSTAEGNRCLEVIEENLIFWKQADQSFTINQVEKSFAYVLYEDETFRIVMIGKIDLLISDNNYTNLPVDHKTYSRDFPVHRKTNQFCNYSYALKSNFLLVNRIGFQTSLKPKDKYKRVPLSYDKAFHEQWRQNVIKWCMHYYDCVQTNDWPMNDTSCDKYNRLCEYYDVCDTSGNETKIYKLDVNFKTDTPWDVSKVLGQRVD